MSSYSSTWTVIRASSIPDKVPFNLTLLPHTKETKAPIPAPSEMIYAVQVHNHFDKTTYTSKGALSVISPSQASPAEPTTMRAPRQKFSLIKDVQINTFYDLVGQVIKLFPSNGCTDLYISDYSPNQLLYFYQWGQDDDGLDAHEGDEFGYVSRSSKNTRKWPGPFGKLTLAITLWPPHSEHAQQNVHEGDFVYLRNVHVRMDRDTKLVASLHQDRRFPDRVDVNVLTDFHDDDRAKDVLRRKRDYHKKFDNESEKSVTECRDVAQKQPEEDKPPSKAQTKKKKKKQERDKARLAQTNLAVSANTKRKREDDIENRLPDSSPPRKLPKQAGDMHGSSPGRCRPTNIAGLNSNIHCSNHLIPPTPLLSILTLSNHDNTTPAGVTYTLPFQNIKTRATVRVVDFFPSNLADFAVPSRKRSEYAVLSDHEQSGSSSAEDTNTCPPSSSAAGSQQSTENDQKWEWRFALLLEEATSPRTRQNPARLKVFVAGADAECLLKLDAEDLRKSPNGLAVLREKLFLLWGDLEERKAKEPRDREQQVLSECSGNSRPSTERWSSDSGPRFQCCLKEYGVKVKTKVVETRSGGRASDGDESEEGDCGWRWERRWRMFGCTIV